MKTSIPKSMQRREAVHTRQRKGKSSAITMVDNRLGAAAQRKLIDIIQGTAQRAPTPEEDEVHQSKSVIQRAPAPEDEGDEVHQSKSVTQRAPTPEDEGDEVHQSKSVTQRAPAPEDEGDEVHQSKFVTQRAPAPEDEGDEVHQSKSVTQRVENKTGMPDGLKGGLENLSGMSMDHVNVHYNSPKPAELNAHAFTQGSDIHVAGGQERHLAHEGWHVVQQAQGRVQPTMQMAGTQINDDAGLEAEADAKGSEALTVGPQVAQKMDEQEKE